MNRATDFECFCGATDFDTEREVAHHLARHDKAGEDAGDFHPCSFCGVPVMMHDIDGAGNSLWIDKYASDECDESTTERHCVGGYR